MSIAGYAVAAAVQAGVALLALPILTRLLGAQEFGAWVLYEPAIAFVAQIGLLGANNGLLKLVGEDGLAPATAWRRIAGPALTCVAVIAGVAGGIGAGLSGKVVVGVPLVILILLEAHTLLGLAALRASNHSAMFAAVMISKAAVLLGMLSLAATADVPKVDTAASMLWWAILPAGTGAVVAYFGVKPPHRDSHGSPGEAKYFEAAVRYGAPLMGAGMVAALIAVGDRFVMALWLPLQAIGAYVVLVKIAGALNLLAMPLNMWFPAARFHHLKDVDGGQNFFRQVSLIVLMLLSSLAALLWLCGPALVTLINPAQQFPPVVSGLLLIAAVATGLTGVVNVGLLQSGKTQWALVSVSLGAILQLVVLLTTVRAWGIYGAAAATCLAAVAALALQHGLSQRFYRLDYRYRHHLAWLLWLTMAIAVADWSAQGSWARLAVCIAMLIPASLLVAASHQAGRSIGAASGRRLP